MEKINDVEELSGHADTVDDGMTIRALAILEPIGDDLETETLNQARATMIAEGMFAVIAGDVATVNIAQSFLQTDFPCPC